MSRKQHSIRVLAQILARSGIACSTCKRPFDLTERIEYDHVHALGMGGPDEPDNLRPLCLPCHQRKTAADAKARGKVRRLTGQTPKRAGRPIPSRPFPKRLKEAL